MYVNEIANEIVEDVPARVRFSKEVCVLPYVDGKSKAAVCSCIGHVTIRNGDWVFPALPKSIASIISLGERSATESSADASHTSKNDAAATASPGVGDKIPTNTVRFANASGSETLENEEGSHECCFEVNDCADMVFCQFPEERAALFEFGVDSSTVDPDFEFFKNAPGRLIPFNCQIVCNQFLLKDNWQIGIKNVAQDSMIPEGSPVNFLVVRSPHTKLKNMEQKGILSNAPAPMPLDADPTTLLYEMPKNYLNTDEGYMNHRDLKVYWMENEQKNICGIVVGTGNLPFFEAITNSEPPKDEISSSNTPDAGVSEPEVPASSVAGEEASTLEAADNGES